MAFIMQKQIGAYTISTDKALLNRGYIHHFLSTQSYWALGVPQQVVDTSINHSLCFGVYLEQTQVGFARLVTDYATFGYLADVFIDEHHRGKGLSKALVQFILSVPELASFRRIMLATKDAHGLYVQFGFTGLSSCDRFMERYTPDVYGHHIETNQNRE